VGAKYYFRGMVALPLERECLLQAYFVDNIENIIGKKAELILYERPLPNEMSNDGKVDLIFISNDNKLLVVETKFLTCDTGSTACGNRRKHRKKVVEQIQNISNKLVNTWTIDPRDIEQMVFTNDDNLGMRNEIIGVKFHSVSDRNLDDWKKNIVDGLQKEINDGHFQNL
jgi:hypothetical protein